MSPRRRLTIEVLTTATAVVGAWLLPRDPTWVLFTEAGALFLLLGLVWWRLRNTN